MYLTDVSIRRPVVAWVLSLILIVFGVFVFWKLPVRELPSGLQPPVVQVQVEYASASAPIVDEEVTQVIEDVIGGAEGIKNIDSLPENAKNYIYALEDFVGAKVSSISTSPEREDTILVENPFDV